MTQQVVPGWRQGVCVSLFFCHELPQRLLICQASGVVAHLFHFSPTLGYVSVEVKVSAPNLRRGGDIRKDCSYHLVAMTNRNCDGDW